MKSGPHNDSGEHHHSTTAFEAAKSNASSGESHSRNSSNSGAPSNAAALMAHFASSSNAPAAGTVAPSRSSFSASSSGSFPSRRLVADNIFAPGSYGQSSPADSPARSSFGAESAVAISSDTRPPLRGTLSDGLSQPHGAPLSSFYSSASGTGSASNLAPPSLVHSLSNSSLTNPSIVSPVSNAAMAPVMSRSASGSGSGSASALGSLYGSQTRQPSLVTPPLQGPLSSSDQRTSLLVLNLPFKIRWQDLKDLFRRSAGTVLRADVSLTPDGRSRGFGSVLMRDAEDAQRAKECFDGFEWMGRRLEVHIEKGGGGGWDSSLLGNSAIASPGAQEAVSPFPSGQSGLPIPQSFVSPATGGYEQIQHAANLSSDSVRSPSYLSPSPHPVSRTSISHQAPGGTPSSGFLTPAAAGADFTSPSLSSASLSRRPSAVSPGGQDQGHGRLAAMSANTPPLPPPQVQQLRSSFSGGSRRPSAQSLGVPGGSGGSNAPSASLPVAPFPPPMPSPSGQAQAGVSPGSIPTQHQLAVLSAQAAQAAVAAQQARVLSDYGGMPDGSYYGRTLFVGNLSYATQWQDLKDLFRSAGNILRADIALGAEGRSRGFGTALFGTKDEAARAVRLFHGYDHNGRTLKVHFDRWARMDAPPPGVLVPARAEDYTSAFSAAQPPSNVGVNGGLVKTSAGGGFVPQGISPGAAGAPLPVQSSTQQQYLGRGMLPQNQRQVYQGQLSQNQHQQYPSPLLSQNRGYMGQVPPLHGSTQAAPSFAPLNAHGERETHRQSPDLRQPGLLQAFEQRRDSHSQSRRPSTLSSVSMNADSQVPHREVNASTIMPEEKKSSNVSANSAHPGRISLPSPPSLPRQLPPQHPQQQAQEQQQHGAGGYYGRIPMPMTPGVPLTPGMPGFTFANLPPQVPSAYPMGLEGRDRSLASPQLGAYHLPATPGAMQGPPTPWQHPNMSAAPGAPLGKLNHGGPSTPRGAPSGPPSSAFNPFFAQAIGAGNQTMPQTPHWGQSYRPPVQSSQNPQGSRQGAGLAQRETSETDAQGASDPRTGRQREQSSKGTVDESALSSRSASPTAGGKSTAGYPFPAVPTASRATNGEGTTQAGGRQPAKKLTLGPAAFALSQRRASTNSPAVSPSIYGIHPASVSNASFGYFGAAMADTATHDEANGSERTRRPSLGAEVLRTPMRDESSGVSYFSPVADADSHAHRKPATGSANGSGDSAIPNIAVAAGHTSTEEMARAIAKMSIQGKALLKRGTSNQGQQKGTTQQQQSAQSPESGEQ